MSVVAVDRTGHGHGARIPVDREAPASIVIEGVGDGVGGGVGVAG